MHISLAPTIVRYTVESLSWRLQRTPVHFMMTNSHPAVFLAVPVLLVLFLLPAGMAAATEADSTALCCA